MKASQIAGCSRKPCKECPFLKSSQPGWLGEWEGPEEVHSYVMEEGVFPCHLTMDTPVERLCTGAILYMKKNAKRAKYVPLLIREQESMKNESTDEILYQSDFVKHHRRK